MFGEDESVSSDAMQFSLARFNIAIWDVFSAIFFIAQFLKTFFGKIVTFFILNWVADISYLIHQSVKMLNHKVLTTIFQFYS